MNDAVYNACSLTTVAAALTHALNAEKPREADEANPALMALIENSGLPIDRVLMYNPDAIALWLYQKYTPCYLPVQKHTSLSLPLQSVMPSVTPVCFGTMYTGALPAVHGIQSYTKPVIKIDTVFDALIRAGKKPVIISTEGDSLSKIFLERGMDYFILPTFEDVHKKALEIIAADEYDFVLIYNTSYDATMHRNAPEGEPSLQMLQDNMKKFDEIATAVRAHWTSHNTLIGFAPDHGCHEIDGGLGSHGLDMPEDLNIMHFYGVIPQSSHQ